LICQKVVGQELGGILGEGGCELPPYQIRGMGERCKLNPPVWFGAKPKPPRAELLEHFIAQEMRLHV